MTGNIDRSCLRGAWRNRLSQRATVTQTRAVFVSTIRQHHMARSRNAGRYEGWVVMGKNNWTKPGYIYLVKAIEPQTHYKIGRSQNPQKRIESMGVKLPYPIEVICLIETENMFELEKQLHQHFDSKRVNGEWFKLDEEDIDYIKGVEWKAYVSKRYSEMLKNGEFHSG